MQEITSAIYNLRNLNGYIEQFLTQKGEEFKKLTTELETVRKENDQLKKEIENLKNCPVV